DLPGMELDPGLHVLTYYVRTKDGSPLESRAVLGVRTNDDKVAPILEMLDEGQSSGFGRCACEQNLDGEEPNASNWLNFFPSADGDYVLLTSDDKGQNWNQPTLAGRGPDDCPQFALSNLENGSDWSSTKTPEVAASLMEMTAFPSPFVDELNLRMQVDEPQDMVIRLVNVTGQVIAETTRTGAKGLVVHRFNTSNLAQGAYFITVETATGVYSQTVIRR
ncbi:MAG: T9SS type A sorting domain-containing protein, partial [Bacteroidota bacterium]